MSNLKELTSKDASLFPTFKQKLLPYLETLRSKQVTDLLVDNTDGQIPIGTCGMLVDNLQGLVEIDLDAPEAADRFAGLWNNMVKCLDQITGVPEDNELGVVQTMSDKVYTVYGASDFANTSVCTDLLSFARTCNELRMTLSNLNLEIEAQRALNDAKFDNTLEGDLDTFFTELNNDEKLAIDVALGQDTLNNLDSQINTLQNDLNLPDDELNKKLEEDNKADLEDAYKKAYKTALDDKERQNNLELEDFSKSKKNDYIKLKNQIQSENASIALQNFEITSNNNVLDQEIRDISDKLESDKQAENTNYQTQLQNLDQEKESAQTAALDAWNAVKNKSIDSDINSLEQQYQDYKKTYEAQSAEYKQKIDFLRKLNRYKIYEGQKEEYDESIDNDRLETQKSKASPMAGMFGQISFLVTSGDELGVGDSTAVMRDPAKMKGLNTLLTNSFPAAENKRKEPLTKQLMNKYNDYQKKQKAEMESAQKKQKPIKRNRNGETPSEEYYNKNVAPMLEEMQVSENDLKAYTIVSEFLKGNKEIHDSWQEKIALDKQTEEKKTPTEHLVSLYDSYVKKADSITENYSVYFNDMHETVKDASGNEVQMTQITQEKLDELDKEAEDCFERVMGTSEKLDSLVSSIEDLKNKRTVELEDAEKNYNEALLKIDNDTKDKKKTLESKHNNKLNELDLAANNRIKEMNGKKKDTLELKPDLTEADFKTMVTDLVDEKRQSLDNAAKQHAKDAGEKAKNAYLQTCKNQYKQNKRTAKEEAQNRKKLVGNKISSMKELFKKSQQQQTTIKEANESMQSVLAGKRDLPASIKQSLKDMLLNIDQGKRRLHRDSDEFTAMREGLTSLQTYLTSTEKPDMKTLKDKLGDLGRAANTYLEAKRTEIHFGKDSTMRTLRLTFAKDLEKLATTSVAEIDNLSQVETRLANEQKAMSTSEKRKLNTKDPAVFMYSALESFVPQGKKSVAETVRNAVQAAKLKNKATEVNQVENSLQKSENQPEKKTEKKQEGKVVTGTHNKPIALGNG